MEIRRYGMAEFFAHPDTPALLEEYAAESAMSELPPPAPSAANYVAMEQTGAVYFLGAFEGDSLLGFYIGIVHPNPHYAQHLGGTESFFVAKEHRKTGAGLALLRRAEETSRALGAVGMFVSAGHQNPLGTVLSRVGYRQTNDVFFKSFCNAPAIQRSTTALPATTPACAALVERIDEIVASVPQVQVTTYHLFHAGVYSRTIRVPAGSVLTSVVIKIPTTVTVHGRATVLVGDGQEVMVGGYQVLPAAAGRKQAYLAHEDTHITMSFKTDAQTVEEAEDEFTDEAERLFSRYGANQVTNTGA